jgi:hypothetical protein
MEREMDRRALIVVRLDEQDDAEKRYRRGKSPHERLQAVEEGRQMIYGYDPTRLQRVLNVALLPSGSIEQSHFTGQIVNPAQV